MRNPTNSSWFITAIDKIWSYLSQGGGANERLNTLEKQTATLSSQITALSNYTTVNVTLNKTAIKQGVVSCYRLGQVVIVELGVQFNSGYPVEGWTNTTVATGLPTPKKGISSVAVAQDSPVSAVNFGINSAGELIFTPYGQTSLHTGNWYRGQLVYIVQN